MLNSEFDNRYATMWIIHYFTLTQNEGGRTYIKKPLQRWNSWEHLVVLVQTSSSKIKYSSCGRLEVYKAQDLTSQSCNSFLLKPTNIIHSTKI